MNENYLETSATAAPLADGEISCFAFSRQKHSSRQPRPARRRAERRTKRWPDFRPLDLANVNDVCTAHAMLEDEHGYDLWTVAVAAAVATRKARTAPQALFVKLLRDGWGQYMPADIDLTTAKRTIRELML